MTVSGWVLGLIVDELEEEEDIRVALEHLKDFEGSVPLEELHRERLQMEQKGAL